METFFIVFGGLFLLKFGFDRTFRKKKNKKMGMKQKERIDNKPEDERAIAIDKLMSNLEQAKSNRPEIIEQDPEIAVRILKGWADKE